MSQTVIQYVLSRLKDHGVTEAFGVPGDFVYPVCDAICDDPDIQWIECANELNAGYAADGYARTKGVGVCVSTYGAGELCMFGALGGAHAENSKPCYVGYSQAGSWWRAPQRGRPHDVVGLGPAGGQAADAGRGAPDAQLANTKTQHFFESPPPCHICVYIEYIYIYI